MLLLTVVFCEYVCDCTCECVSEKEGACACVCACMCRYGLLQVSVAVLRIIFMCACVLLNAGERGGAAKQLRRRRESDGGCFSFPYIYICIYNINLLGQLQG